MASPRFVCGGPSAAASGNSGGPWNRQVLPDLWFRMQVKASPGGPRLKPRQKSPGVHRARFAAIIQACLSLTPSQQRGLAWSLRHQVLGASVARRERTFTSAQLLRRPRQTVPTPRDGRWPGGLPRSDGGSSGGRPRIVRSLGRFPARQMGASCTQPPRRILLPSVKRAALGRPHRKRRAPIPTAAARCLRPHPHYCRQTG
jgi:hypothetical protein